MVFQSYSLFPNMSALDNVGFGLRMRKIGAGERRQRVAVRQAVPAGAGQPGYCLRKFRGRGCCVQRAGIGLAEISVSHAVPP